MYFKLCYMLNVNIKNTFGNTIYICAYILLYTGIFFLYLKKKKNKKHD